MLRQNRDLCMDVCSVGRKNYLARCFNFLNLIIINLCFRQLGNLFGRNWNWFKWSFFLYFPLCCTIFGMTICIVRIFVITILFFAILLFAIFVISILLFSVFLFCCTVSIFGLLVSFFLLFLGCLFNNLWSFLLGGFLNDRTTNVNEYYIILYY